MKTLRRLVSKPLKVFKKVALQYPSCSVVMFHPGRCGSTVVVDLLRQNSDICWDGEIYRGSGKLKKLNDKPDVLWCKSKHFPDHPYEFLKERKNRCNSRIYGFEVKDFHLRDNGIDVKEFADNIRSMQFENVIVVTRRNVLRQVLSKAVLSQTRKPHITDAEKPTLTKVRLDIECPVPENYPGDSLFDLFNRFETFSTLISNALDSQRTLSLCYEDDIENNPGIAYGKVCDFLGSQKRKVKVRMGKTNPFPLRESITNFDEVEAALAFTKYAWMLS